MKGVLISIGSRLKEIDERKEEAMRNIAMMREENTEYRMKAISSMVQRAELFQNRIKLVETLEQKLIGSGI